MATLFRVLALLAFLTAGGGAAYSTWCVRRARPYAKGDVPWWKLMSSSAGTNYDYYEKPGHTWIERATLGQALLPLGFFGGLAFWLVSDTL
ncbi:MAG TPA: hypothetical protein VNO75_01220 [Gemmatimonadaceae bacterium]|nr:hypothetical protein [Gemmatimonadaceae bacterium]